MSQREYWLPPEILRKVISYFISPVIYIAESSVAPYATVSRDWQAIIERYTFSTLRLNNRRRLEEFRQITARDKRRRSYIRKIKLTVQLESYYAELRREFETPEEHSRNNKIFEETILSLLRYLATWSENRAGIKLSIAAQSLSDSIYDGFEEVRRKENILSNDLLHRRFERSYLQVQEDNMRKIPAVNVITKLKVIGGHAGDRLIQPVSCAIIASRLPRLHSISLRLWDSEKRDKALREANRNGKHTVNHDQFARYSNIWPSSVKHFKLYFWYDPPEDHTYFPAGIVGVDVEDPLSVSLRHFSQQLTTITLTGVVGREFFWPFDSKGQLPFWPNLRDIYLEHKKITPSGQWLFEYNPEDDVNEWEPLAMYGEDLLRSRPDYLLPPAEDRNINQFRTKASGLMSDFYVSAGHAAQRMPKLKSMVLASGPSGELWTHRFEYTTDGENSLLYWLDEVPFQPEKRVLQVWREVAREHTGSISNLYIARSLGSLIRRDALLLDVIGLSIFKALICSSSSSLTPARLILPDNNPDPCDTRPRPEQLTSSPLSRLYQPRS
ncbi:predicted protein [Paecilomyces variotii No. 5]|uniref:DUF6546 domain-containing protein n=1 Tax=Byssochlamys spectabilis (strain No. 5 / NBRC 109023) TaxID=1356009 RepID=V5FRH5_BYSSN|nr:predicted protein [Paecilomyces variotii No. 5]